MPNCKNCERPIPTFERNCPYCQSDVGFPNVRAAEDPTELAALDQRVKDANVSARGRECETVLADFGRSVLKSQAVIARSLSAIQSLFSTDNTLYVNFYKEVVSGGRLPEDNAWDRGRLAVDGTLFPHYHDKVTFGALSLDRRGPQKYGLYAIVLREEMIQQRATVFEENSFVFCQTKHKIVVGDPVPPGYRATWATRDKIAVAKLHSRLDGGTPREAYPGILLDQGKGKAAEDFIEVHIYGPIHRIAVERISGPQPKSKADKTILRSIKRKAGEVETLMEIG